MRDRGFGDFVSSSVQGLLSPYKLWRCLPREEALLRRNQDWQSEIEIERGGKGLAFLR